MSLGTIASHIINLAIEGCLIEDLRSILTPNILDAMIEGKLKELVADSTSTNLRRENPKEKRQA